MTVAVLSTEDRHWSRNVTLYPTQEAAEAEVIALLDNEYGERVGTYSTAVARLTECYGWTIHIDVCDVPMDTADDK